MTWWNEITFNFTIAHFYFNWINIYIQLFKWIISNMRKEAKLLEKSDQRQCWTRLNMLAKQMKLEIKIENVIQNSWIVQFPAANKRRINVISWIFWNEIFLQLNNFTRKSYFLLFLIKIFWDKINSIGILYHVRYSLIFVFANSNNI